MLSNRVQETTTTTGTGTVNLAGAPSGKETFVTAFGSGGVAYYCIVAGSEWEVGRGTITSGSPDTLARTTVIASSNADAAVSFSAGTKTVFNALPAGYNGGDVQSASSLGFSMVNGTLVPSVAASALTIAIKTKAGNDPSASDPVYVVFRNATAATGDYAVLTLTAAYSLVISSGSTMGAVNSTAFRLWVLGFNDGGTFRLGAINCRVGGASPTSIDPINEAAVRSATAEGGAGGADSAGTIYAGATVTSKAFHILGYMDWNSGLGTVGTWSAGPTVIQLMGPGIRKPGERVQLVRDTDDGFSTTNTAYQATGLSAVITPTSPCNPVRVLCFGLSSLGTGEYGLIGLFRDTTEIGVGANFGSAANTNTSVAMEALDLPNTAGAVDYNAKLKSNTGVSVSFPAGSHPEAGSITAEEIMA